MQTASFSPGPEGDASRTLLDPHRTRQSADSGPLSQRELRKIMVITPGAISDLMRALEKGGLVAAEPSAADKREGLWSIIAEGRRVLEASVEQTYSLLLELFRGFTSDRQDSFLESLRLLQRNAQRVKQTLEMEL